MNKDLHLIIDKLYIKIKKNIPIENMHITFPQKGTSELLAITPISHKENFINFEKNSISKICFETKNPIIINHLDESFLYEENTDNPFNYPIDSFVLLPIIYDDNHICGFLTLFKEEDSIKKRYFSKKEIFEISDIIKECTQDNKEIFDNIQNIIIEIEEENLPNNQNSEFFSSIVHDIRTPMNAVLGFLELLEEEAEQKQIEYIRAGHKSAEMVIALINDVLDFTKIASGKLEIDLHYFTPIEEFENTALLFYHNALSKDIDFIIYFDPKIPYLIKSGPIRLKQIINNLLSNAIKFTPIGGKIVLEILYDKKLDNLNINVKDTGIGIPKEAQANLFKPFEQASKKIDAKYGGTGLGLTISKKLANLLEGELSFKSEEGEGTTFTLTVPCYSISNAPLSLKVDHKKIPYIFFVEGCKSKKRYIKYYSRYFDKLGLPYEIITASKLLDSNIDKENSLIIGARLEYENKNAQSLIQKYKEIFIILETEIFEKTTLLPKNITILNMPVFPQKLFNTIQNIDINSLKTKIQEMRSSKFILLVDDSIINTRLMEEIAKRMGATSLSALNGQQAIELFKENNHIDTIFIDKNMPELNGIDAIKEIRKLPKGKNVVIYGLTGDTDKETIEEMKDAGADTVLTKPIQVAQLKEILAD